MRVIGILIVLSAMVVSIPLVAQQQAEGDLPTYTLEQRWNRSSRATVVSYVAAISYAKSQGQSPKEYAEFLAELFAPGWGEPGSGSVAIIRGIRANMLGWSDSKFEITKSSQKTVTARINRPWTKHFGEEQTLYGVSLVEYEEVTQVFFERLAKHLGLQYEGRIDADWFYITFSQN